MQEITFGSLCSGIEAASVAWHPLGMRTTWLAEVEPFPCAVLDHHYPHTINMGDMNDLRPALGGGFIEAPDILIGGTPCQSFSVAGLRKGLEDERGQLTLEFVRILDAIDNQRPAGQESVALWENVPGVLSSKDNAFGCFLGALCGEVCELKLARGKWSHAGIVHGPQRTVAWRVLDAQYFGVAQRRRRVFVVASARNGFDPGQVLFESESVRRDTPPSRETQTGLAGSAARGLDGFRMTAFGEYADDETASTAKARDYKDATDLVVHGFQTRIARNGRGDMGDICHALSAQSGGTGKGDAAPCVAFAQNSRNELRLEGGDGQRTGALTTGGGKPGQGAPTILSPAGVRRLTPTECERLQGFPDMYTQVPYRGKASDKCPDGPRYKALGNSMAVPVIEWLGRRIQKRLILGRA